MTSIKCKNCGADVPANMKFCGTCGTPAEHPEPVAETVTVEAPAQSAAPLPTSKGIWKKLIKPAILVVALIVVVLIARNFFKPEKYEKTNNFVQIYSGEESTMVIPVGKGKKSINGMVTERTYSIDGKAAAVLVREDAESSETSLYLITDKVTLIKDNVYSMNIATSGKGIAFIQDESDGYGELCLWTNGKVKTVASDFQINESYAVSPDGKTVVYSVYDEEEQEKEGFLYNGKTVSLGKDVYPIAVSNGAKYIYYFKNDALYVQKGTKENTKNKLGKSVYGMCLNKDFSEIIYASNNKAYISRHGKERQSLSGTFTAMIWPAYTQIGFYTQMNVAGVASFANTFYREGDDVVYINGNFKTHSVAKGVTEVQLADDGKTVYYLKNDSVHKINGSKENAKDTELVEDDVRSFLSTRDGKAVYYYTTDDELFYRKGKGKPVSVAEDVDNEEGYIKWDIFGKDKLYYVSDGELFVSGGGKGKTVKGIQDEAVNIYAGPKQLKVITKEDRGDYEYNTYVSKDGKKFELIDVE